MAIANETMLYSTHAFKAVAEERGLGPLWGRFVHKRTTTWSAMGLALGLSPHESSDALSQKWTDQVLLPLCRLNVGDEENEHCIKVRRLHLDAWTLVHSEARHQSSEVAPGARAPAPLGPADKRARRKEFTDMNKNISVEGEKEPAECLFDDLHEMLAENYV